MELKVLNEDWTKAGIDTECFACNQLVPKGTKIFSQHMTNGEKQYIIDICPTCYELLFTYGSMFVEAGLEPLVTKGCVYQVLQTSRYKGLTPERMLTMLKEASERVNTALITPEISQETKEHVIDGQISLLMKQIHQNAKNKGFYNDAFNFPEKIALIHSELSEALEADRNNSRADDISEALLLLKEDSAFIDNFEADIKNTVGDELADAVIRIFDLAEALKLPLEWHIKAKMRYNSLRPYKHNKNY